MSQITFSDLFGLWMSWRIEIGTYPKTLAENKNEWNRFLADSPLAKKKVKLITSTDLEDFFLKITANYAITQKRFTNVKSVISGMLKYACCRLKIIPCNPLNDVDLIQLRGRFKPQKKRKDTYTDAERKAILDYLSEQEEDVYNLAIQLSFYLCVRIGELASIKKEDYQNGELHIGRSIRRIQRMNENFDLGHIEYTVEERVKGNTTEGFRNIPLSSRAQSIIQKALALNPEGEYLFMKDEKPIIGNTFNERLEKTCNTLGIKYRSSHQIRFTNATTLFEAGVPINQLSTLLGHSDTKTTFHYIVQKDVDDKSKAIIRNVLK